MKLSRLTRSEYLAQPAQLPRRAWRHLVHAGRDQAVVRLPWGFPLRVNPRESIGQAVIALNVLDLVVTESIWRLLDDGETAADIGANIGHMTSVMGARLRAGGTIHCFEPLPPIAAVLRENLARWPGLTEAVIHFHPEALADKETTARLHLPADFSVNQGTASLDAARPGFGVSAETVAVSCRRLDQMLGPDVRLGLIKVDVEGAEARVFRGAEGLLSTGRIRDIVFEEHGDAGAESFAYLRRMGYEVHRVIRHRDGPVLIAVGQPDPNDIDPPTYLGTLDPTRARARLSPRGWTCLR